MLMMLAVAVAVVIQQRLMGLDTTNTHILLIFYG
jgi:hypothetical protein